MTPTVSATAQPAPMTADEFVRLHGGESGVELTPDLIVVVRLPTDRTGDVLIKVGESFRTGTGVVVVLDPATRSKTVYRQTDDFPQRFSNGDELTLPDVLPGFTVPVRTFFE